MTLAPLTRQSILAQAWPIMLGQITVPLVGLVDTAVIGPPPPLAEPAPGT